MIYVTSRARAQRIVESGWPVVDALISVRGIEDTEDHAFADRHPRALRLAFDDTSSDWQSYKAPTAEDVEAALRFGSTVRDDEALLIHCAAGISRSAGLALGVLCLRLRDPYDATCALDDAMRETTKLGLRDDEHYPNARIVFLLDRRFNYRGELVRLHCGRHEILPASFWNLVKEDPLT